MMAPPAKCKAQGFFSLAKAFSHGTGICFPQSEILPFSRFPVEGVTVS